MDIVLEHNILPLQSQTRSFLSRSVGEVTDLVAQYLRRTKRDNGVATIDAVANIVDVENKEQFLDLATSDEYRADATFAPTPRGIREIEKYEVSGDEFSVRFDKKLFRKQVEYKSEEEDLIIHNVTPDMLSEDLRRASSSDDE